MMSPTLFDDAHALVSDVINRKDAVSRIERLTVRNDGAVLIVTTAAGVRLVLKLADGMTDRSVSFERVATVTDWPARPEHPSPKSWQPTTRCCTADGAISSLSTSTA